MNLNWKQIKLRIELNRTEKRGTIQLYNLQSTTMPLLSLNSHNLPPAGSTSYSALGAGGGTSLTHPTMANLGLLDTGTLLGSTGLSGLGVGPSVGGITGATSLYGLSGGGGGAGGLGSSYGPPFLDVASSASYPFTAAALRQASKMKMLDEIDIPLTRYNRSSPCSPIPPNNWGLDEFTDGLSVSMMHNRGGLALGALDLDSEYNGLIIFQDYN